MSKRKSGLNIHGILLLNKALGVSSNQALQQVRRLFNANKAGHTGSLDPLATGLLPLCFGEATKVSALMLDDDKRYAFDMRLGVLTESGDAESEIIATHPVPKLTEQDIEQCLRHFTGEIEQVPPMYSALKHQGKKLYELARQGIEIERTARKISIYELKLLGFTEDILSLEVLCSKGTYIRSLAEDIGQYFGCGGTVTRLHRLQVGLFQLANAYTLEQLTAMPDSKRLMCLLPVDTPLQGLAAVALSESQTTAINYGQAITMTGVAQGIVRLYYAEQFLGLGEMRLDGKLHPKKLFNLNS